jgi:hypothetical protein
MSHFTRIQTVIQDQIILVDTLRQLHHYQKNTDSLQFEVGERVPIRGYQDTTEYGQVVVNTRSNYDIGFQRQPDQSFAVCADWWGVEGNSSFRQESFLNDVNRAYAHLKVRKQVLEQGLIIEEEVILPSGEIDLVVCERF